MPDMHDPHLAGFDSPIHQVGISPGGEHARSFNTCKSSTARMIADQINGLPDCLLDVECALWVSLFEIVKNRPDIAPRARRVPNPHGRWRFQRVSISSSGTDSPRRAWSSPS